MNCGISLPMLNVIFQEWSAAVGYEDCSLLFNNQLFFPTAEHSSRLEETSSAAAAAADSFKGR